MIGVYKITSPSNNIYIGQSIDIEKRFKGYKNINSSKRQTILHRSFLKYGIDNHDFEVLIECNIEDLNKYERYYQDLFKATEHNGLNCRLTSSEDKSGILSEETKKKMSKSRKGRVVSVETRKKLSEASKGMSDETKQKISNAGKGRVCSEETKGKIRQALLGKQTSVETRSRISKSRKGITPSEETKLKMSESRKGMALSEKTKAKISKSNSKLILNTCNGIFYFGIKSAAESLCINPKSLGKYLVGINNNKTPFVYV